MPDKDRLAFVEKDRDLPEKRSAEDRTEDFLDIYTVSSEEKLAEQADRCLDCGNPYCQWKCPLHNHIPNWLELVRRGKLKAAARTMLNTNPLPEICGRVCPQDRLCEQACTINTGFGAVTIGNIEKQISDMAIENGWYDIAIPAKNGKKVAVIGSGPAGIGCAEYLVRHGAEVVVYEKAPEIGGLLTFGIPEFKLEKSVLLKRREHLEKQGIVFQLNTEVGQDISFDQLRADYDAVFLGMGAYEAVDGGLQDPENAAIIPSLDYLIGVTNENHQLNMQDATFYDLKDQDVMVFGGGDTAMDCVRTAIRQGAKSVKCVYRRAETDMPGSRKEVVSAREEGIEFVFHKQPTAIVQDGDKLSITVTDKVSEQEETLIADKAILAFGFRPNPPDWLTDLGLELDDSRRVKTFSSPELPNVCQGTSLANIYVGGDMSRGADLVVTAIADGRAAAEQMLSDLLIAN